MLVGFYQTLLLVLAVSGAVKITSPDQAAKALVAAHMVRGPIEARYKVSRRGARLLGAAEMTLAFAGFAFSQSTALSVLVAMGVAVTFVGFNAFISRLEALDPDASCGCFGKSAAPPGPMHKVFNFSAAALAVSVAVLATATSELPSFGNVVSQGWTVSIPYLAALVIGSIVFLHGPALVGELHHATDHGHHDHGQTATFSVDHSALTPQDQDHSAGHSQNRLGRRRGKRR